MTFRILNDYKYNAIKLTLIAPNDNTKVHIGFTLPVGIGLGVAVPVGAMVDVQQQRY